jgi:dTDP-glucose 4,6-dehydratase
MKRKNILVTGGAGFIGSAFVRLLVKKGIFPVIIDKLTYAGDMERLEEVKGRFKFYKADVCNKREVELVFSREKPEIIAHFAAESHVDRSIKDAAPFLETNIKGTQVLLDASRKYKSERFVFISTDEIYGEIASGKFKEDSPLRPNNPYAASKAAADLLVQAYIRTSKFPALIVRPSNNYGPWQYPEKLIPLAILKILEKGRVPVYGKGLNVREWLYVDDCVSGIMAIMLKGRIGQVYNLGSSCESRNIDTIKLLLKTLGVKQDRFEFVKDRLGHDIRYSLNSRKAAKEFGWKPAVKLPKGIGLTVGWSLKHQNWLKSKLKEINRLYSG